MSFSLPSFSNIVFLLLWRRVFAARRAAPGSLPGRGQRLGVGRGGAGSVCGFFGAGWAPRDPAPSHPCAGEENAGVPRPARPGARARPPAAVPAAAALRRPRLFTLYGHGSARGRRPPPLWLVGAGTRRGKCAAINPCAAAAPPRPSTCLFPRLRSQPRRSSAACPRRGARRRWGGSLRQAPVERCAETQGAASSLPPSPGAPRRARCGAAAGAGAAEPGVLAVETLCLNFLFSCMHMCRVFARNSPFPCSSNSHGHRLSCWKLQFPQVGWSAERWPLFGMNYIFLKSCNVYQLMVCRR